jgi:4-diphosphocytidyl-2-C-methyl-D-erythritol kinase
MTLRLHAPAKINLGLEIVGRRDNGYHEVRTILAAIGLFDHLDVSPARETVVYVDRADLAGEENLVTVAARLVAADFPTATATFSLRKAIPAAAGLGGASSDAAATLVALNHLYALDLDAFALERYAASMGSDVPFFIAGGCALATGRGECLTPLPAPTSLVAVVVSPRIEIPRKTATLYGALRPSDFSDGQAVEQSAGALGSGDRTLFLGNAFQRALYAIEPSLANVPAELARAGASTIGISGAGPSHYALEPDGESGAALADRLRARFGDWAHVGAYPFIDRGVAIVTD